MVNGKLPDQQQIEASLNKDRAKSAQRRAGLWVTVDGGTHEERQLLTTALGAQLQTLGFDAVKQVTGDHGKLSPFVAPADSKVETLRDLIARERPGLFAQQVVLRTPRHNTPEVPPESSRVYSGRAECMRDVDEVACALNVERMGLVAVHCQAGYFGPNNPSGEIMVEFQFDQPVAHEKMKALMRQVDEDAGDVHVLYETMEPIPLVNNPCDREYGRK